MSTRTPRSEYPIRRIFATTSIDGMRREGGGELRRVLRARDLIAVGVGTMIGGGIFTTIGAGVQLAGPAVIIAFVFAGLASFFAALCYAELGAMVPSAGSAYTYAYATLGQLVAWIVGFALLFEYGISAAPVAQAFSAGVQGAASHFGYALPFWARQSQLVFHTHGAWYEVAKWDFAGTQCDVVGALFVLALSALLSVGIRETAATNNVFVVLKLLALAVFVLAGISLFHPANLVPFAPLGWGTLVPFSGGGGSGIIPAAAYVFFTYIGFDAATTTAEECRNPQRDVPIGVMGALIVGTVVYCAVAIVLVGAVPWQHVDQANPLGAAIAPLHNAWLDWTITIGIIAGTTSVALSSLLGQTRIFFVMARDGMLPPGVAKVNARFGTPVVTTMLTGVAIAIMTLILPLTQLLNLVSTGTLAAFIVVCGGVIYLRYKRPDLPRPFRSPFVPAFPIVGILLSLVLVVFGLSRETLLWFVGSLAVGLVFYFTYSIRHADPNVAHATHGEMP